MKPSLTIPAWITVAASLVCGTAAFGQGMPAEARKNIHLLFNQHEAVTRTVTMTKTGYISLTESGDPKVASALKAHVRQMEARLRDGLMVRRHDPAFAEFTRYYDDISHVIEPTEKGLKVTVTGKTPEAVKVAQNHANVVTDFATNGWEAHDRDHAAVIRTDAAPAAAAPGKPAKGGACCENGGECQMGGAARPGPDGEKNPSAARAHH